MISSGLDVLGFVVSLVLFFAGSGWASSVAKSLTPAEFGRLQALLPNDGGMFSIGALFLLAFVAPMNPLLVLVLAVLCAVAAAYFGPLRVAKVSIAEPNRRRLLAANWTLWLGSVVFVFVRVLPRLGG